MKKCLACQCRFEGQGWRCPQCGQEPEQQGAYCLFAPSLSETAATYDAARHELVERSEERHFWFRTRTALILWVFERFFSHARSYFEVGCGTGFVISCLKARFPRLQTVGSDLLLSGLQRARRRLPDTELLQLDVLRIPYEAEFDVIGAYDVIEHIEEDGAALSQFHSALEAGGGLILTVPQHPSLWSHHDEQARHVRRYVAAELRTKVERAGFRIVRMTSVYFTTLLFMWASRRWSGGKGGNGEFHPPSYVNASLHRLLGFERSLIRMGIDLPAGSSLLVVARKQ